MKTAMRIVVIVLAVLPSDIWAQSSDRTTSTSSPLLWRDGYINWRGNLVKPNWQFMRADDGTDFAVHFSTKPAHYAAAYIIDEDAFNKSNLFEFRFDCLGKVAEVLTNMDLKRAQTVEGKVRPLVCDGR
jgi:hypothetical protein